MAEVANRHLLLVPGIRDNTPQSERFHERVADRLREAGLATTVFRMNWHDGEGLAPKIGRLNGRVTELVQDGKLPYTGGTSLGGAAAVSAFAENPEVSGAFTVSSRLNPNVDAEGLQRLRTITPAGADLIPYLGTQTERLSTERRARILTMRPQSGDKHIPLDASTIPGARDTVFPFDASHDLGIGEIFSSRNGAGVVVDFFNKLPNRT